MTSCIVSPVLVFLVLVCEAPLTLYRRLLFGAVPEKNLYSAWEAVDRHASKLSRIATDQDLSLWKEKLTRSVEKTCVTVHLRSCGFFSGIALVAAELTKFVFVFFVRNCHEKHDVVA